ncbi:hypothetical protein FNV43_RR12521 [Rhamnella rubrinervis]|uniref:Uncharacterized protein n=1 Tax=Rhamnella rubrinervis TaxID=2594499 RepID=A0A8K0MIY8_9ROSA|nr:hypothetical protein FNV43_RR12521 [Rhamnella rubrinervis]
MSSSSGTSNLRYRKTVRSTGSDNVLGSIMCDPQALASFVGVPFHRPGPRKSMTMQKKLSLVSVLRYLMKHEALPVYSSPSCTPSKKPLKSSVSSSMSGPVTKALSPPKRSVASTSYDPPIATCLTKGDGSQALAYQRGTSEMPRSNLFDWNRHGMAVIHLTFVILASLKKRVEHGLMTLKELQATDNAILQLLDRKDASDRRFKEF